MISEHAGMMIIVSSPSGVGKTTLVRLLAERNKNFEISISNTTRIPRENEIEGKDYHFINEDKFKDLIKAKSFYEYARVFNNLYGTLKDSVIKNLSKGKDVLFDIDWQGSKQIKKLKLRNKLISIFILPPNIKTLKDRLSNRDMKDKLILKEILTNGYWTKEDRFSLSPQGQSTLDLISGTTIANAEKAIENLPVGTRTYLEEISPSTKVADIQTKVLLMHDTSDLLIPPEESKRFAEHLSSLNKYVYHTEFTFFKNVLKVHKSSSEPPPRVTRIRSKGSAVNWFACWIAEITWSMDSSPCTWVGMRVLRNAGNLLLITLRTSRTAAPVGEVMMARWFANFGIGFLSSLANRPSCCKRRRSSSKARLRAPSPASSICSATN